MTATGTRATGSGAASGIGATATCGGGGSTQPDRAPNPRMRAKPARRLRSMPFLRAAFTTGIMHIAGYQTVEWNRGSEILGTVGYGAFHSAAKSASWARSASVTAQKIIPPSRQWTTL
jgi:hypothetical protein